MSVQLGVISEILQRSPFVASIFPPVDVLPMLTMMILQTSSISGQLAADLVQLTLDSRKDHTVTASRRD
jgi:hypothetical protein